MKSSPPFFGGVSFLPLFHTSLPFPPVDSNDRGSRPLVGPFLHMRLICFDFFFSFSFLVSGGPFSFPPPPPTPALSLSLSLSGPILLTTLKERQKKKGGGWTGPGWIGRRIGVEWRHRHGGFPRGEKREERKGKKKRRRKKQ